MLVWSGGWVGGWGRFEAGSCAQSQLCGCVKLSLYCIFSVGVCCAVCSVKLGLSSDGVDVVCRC